MNRKMVFYMLGQIVQLEAALLLLPTAVALIYRESSIWAFLITAGIALAVGSVLRFVGRRRTSEIFAKEGFVIVALAWLVMSAIGALPFVIGGDIPSYVDAFFETVSGFTTTGSSVLTNVEALSHAALFWRSFSHWIGGMGVLVLIMAITPTVSGRSMHVLRAEMPGPIIGKLVPRARDTAKILYLMYAALTVAEALFLWCGDMNLFESLVHAFGTAGTGGFGIRGDSIGGYSAYSQWVITAFMLLFGVNFNLYYLMLLRRVGTALRSRELWVYGGLVVIASTVIGINIRPLYGSVGETIRTAVFQVSSIVTTTGYSTANFDLWPGLSRGILFILLFVGGCAGSTAGGLKISRLMLMVGSVRRELRRLLHPHAVDVVRSEGKRVDEATVNSVGIYFILYCLLLAATFLLISFEPYPIETNFSAAVTALNNVGPGVGVCGPAGSFAMYSDFSKIVLSFAMLFGRLEIYPLLFALTPSTWTKK